MKRITLLYMTAGLLALGAPALRADDTASTNTPSATVHKHAKGEGRKFLTAIGLSAADLKGLSKADRRTKIQSAAETTEANLKQKQANGTITAQEKTDLAMIERHLQRAKNSAKAE